MAGGAQAEVTRSLIHDGNGRLVGVITTPGSGGTSTAAYAYDAAHNRTQPARSGPSTHATIQSLPEGDLLSPMEALVSPDGRFTFALPLTGRLELWREGGPVWTLDDLAGAPRFAMTEAGARHSLERGQAPDASAWSAADDGALIATIGAGNAAVWSSTSGVGGGDACHGVWRQFRYYADGTCGRDLGLDRRTPFLARTGVGPQD